jgi:hypothetical protein
MPKRLAFGTNLGLFARRVGRHAGRMMSQKSQRAIQRACIDSLEDRTFFSTTVYVAPWGSDWGNGSAGAPFRTIQEGANAAWWGDTVSIMGGIYRETVTPPHAGVTFTNFANQSVNIVGTNQVTGFQWAGGATYVANSPNLGEGNNQVFVDGQLLNEARFPNSSFDPSHPTKLTIQAYSNGTIFDSNLNQPSGWWVGAQVSVTPGDQWVSYTGVVNASGPGWINVSLPGTSGVEAVNAGSHYYLFGTNNALDSGGEYYINGSNQLYLADPGYDNPNNHDVEVQARQYGFNLQYASNTTIQGIGFVACSIYAGWNSPNSTINYCTLNYVGNFANTWGSGWAPPASGVQLWGSGDMIENSTIGYSAGDGVFVGNSNIKVLNNTIHDIDWSATDAAGVRTYNNSVLISGNTIYNTGRDGINVQGTGDVVQWNTIHDFMLQTYDGGGIYTINIGGGGTIASNTIYNAHKSYLSVGLAANGIMLDSNSAYWSVHDNNVFNVDAALEVNNNAYGDQIYNNKFSGSQWAVETNGWPGFQFSWWGTQLYNNYFGGNFEYGNSVSQWANSSGGAINTTTQSPPVVPPPPPPVVAVPPPPPPAPASPPPPPPPAVTVQTGPGYPASGNWTATAFWQYSNVQNVGGAIGYTYNGSWLEYGGIQFGTGLSRFNANLAVDPSYAGQKIEVFLDSLNSSPIATLTVQNTGSWYNYAWENTTLSTAVSGLHNVFIKFVGSAGIANLKNWQFS